MVPPAPRHRLPGAALLQEPAWEARHRVLLLLLAVHVPLLLLAGTVRDLSHWHVLLDVLPLVVLGTGAAAARLPCWARELLAAAGLVAASSAVVHLAGGVTEAHFHYFVVLALLPLYQSWPPLALAVGLVVLQHGVVGVLEPARVFDDVRAAAHPWLWGLVHGAAVLVAAAASALVVALNEQQRSRLAAERDAARAEHEQALRDLADTDPLTGLANRRRLTTRLEQVLAAEGAGVLFLDLDGFKQVNDVRGHEVGDVLLRRCAEVLAAAVRPDDLLARLGGDEFVVLCPGLLDPDALARTAQRLRDGVRSVAPDALALDVSIGTALARPGDDARAVLERADRAMYSVKRGRVLTPPARARL